MSNRSVPTPRHAPSPPFKNDAPRACLIRISLLRIAGKGKLSVEIELNSARYDRAGRLAEHIIRTHYQSGPASRSCQYPTCDPSIVYTKIDYADHLHVVHACNLLNQKAIKAGHQRVDGDETRLRVVDQDLQMRARGAEAATLADNFDESACTCAASVVPAKTDKTAREFEQLCKFKIKDLRAFLKDKGIVGIQDSSWNRRSLSAKIVDLGFTVKDVKT